MQPKIADKDDLKTYGPERDGAIWDSVVTVSLRHVFAIVSC